MKLLLIFRWRNFYSISLPLIAAFLFLQLVVEQNGGQNARSRMAALRAMVEQTTFRIDPHIIATSDWARTPDGAYYSNKAPGPMLLGYPVFLVLDILHMAKERGYRDERGLRHFPDTFQTSGVSLLMQALPFALLVAWVIHWLALQGVSKGAQWFAGLALLFGNTAACFMNSYFGHGITAVFTLGGLMALLHRNWFWTSFCFGCALLSDYGFGMMTPAIVIVFGLALIPLSGRERMGAIRRFACGALVPGVLWVWYHLAAFGGVFAIANKFQNPDFLDKAAEGVQLWGIFGLPSLDTLWKLIFGQERGILFTQPWLLVVPLAALLSRRNTMVGKCSVAIFCVLGLAGMLFMNASFGGWHGGGGPGPRYLSHVFPCFALWAGLVLDRSPSVAKVVLWAGLVAAVVFRALVYAGPLEAPVENLWSFYTQELARPSYTPVLRLYLFGIVVTVALAVGLSGKLDATRFPSGGVDTQG